MRRFWIGVASYDHVKTGIKGKFRQLCHGKSTPLKRMRRDDWIIYYSPKYEFSGNRPLRAFTAIGRVKDNRVYQYEMAPNFIPHRRDIEFINTPTIAPITNLLDHLNFIEDKRHYGYKFHFGHFEINEADFKTIYKAMMGITPSLKTAPQQEELFFDIEL